MSPRSLKNPKAAAILTVSAWLFALGCAAPVRRPARVTLRRVDVSADSWYVMAALEGASARLGRRIAAYRELIGPLRVPERLRRVPGLGPRRLERWSPWLREPALRHERLDTR